jgi:hypothetical protein
MPKQRETNWCPVEDHGRCRKVGRPVFRYVTGLGWNTEEADVTPARGEHHSVAE